MLRFGQSRCNRIHRHTLNGFTLPGRSDSNRLSAPEKSVVPVRSVQSYAKLNPKALGNNRAATRRDVRCWPHLCAHTPTRVTVWEPSRQMCVCVRIHRSRSLTHCIALGSAFGVEALYSSDRLAPSDLTVSDRVHERISHIYSFEDARPPFCPCLT